MTNKICKLHRLERREVFMKIIDEMKKAGWQQLNADKTNKDKLFVMYSTGNDGTKNNYIELRPFDTIRNNSELLPSLDIRDPKVFYTDGSYRLIRGYDKESGTGTGEDSWFSLAFHHGKINYSSGATALNYEKYMVDLYLYVDKDTVIYCVYANDDEIPSHKGKTVIGFIGLPDEYYQPELFSPYSCPFSVMFSCGSRSQTAAHTTDRTKFGGSYSYSNANSTFYWDKVFLKAPSNEGKIVFTPLYMGDSSDGFRGKYDGFYIYKGSGFIYGDITEIVENGEIHKYKLFYTAAPVTNQYNSFSEYNVALRIE
ncbi:hypothetical protein NYE71_27930 [Bacillus sp. FSL K6-0273]|uniref:hypothetical protein n=1 Tax=Bacillus TaxID=1386 RepID=UPI0008FE4165|nr:MULTISPECIES: hypothetical protein [Bacillus cereus group]MCU5488251.1 hypothetical protein [Bacillus cereus]MDF9466939.1 hypothetical protein [Bacillus cereus]OJD99301.1 hypothetical protein A9489_27570 [Bacillus thuringiensis]PFA79740.1 hypothetical protein CN400_26875 [Bacillus thuringiensis]PFE93403.1 hypothetical protein CN321_11430 [Bacillus thuringiensis]